MSERERRRIQADGGRGLLERLERDRRDQAAELARARRDGEAVRRKSEPAPPPVRPRPSLEQMVVQLWRCARWSRPDGIPEGWTEDERPEGM